MRGGLFTNRDSSMGACMCTYPTSFLARARVRGCPNAIIAYGFVKKWKPARVGSATTARLETRDGRRRRRAFERAIMDATRADGISKLMIAEKEAQAIVGAAREGA